MAINDTTADLPQVGTDLGSFLSNLMPGVTEVIFTLGIIGGIIALFGALVYVVKNAITKIKSN